MKSSQPEIIERTQTVIIEANEKQSRQHGVGSYETVMNKGIEINNGDVISLESAFVDTSNIDPNNIFLAEDVKITWNNGLYLINQQLETLQACSKRTDTDTITDNLPLVLCQFQPKADTSDMVLFGEVTSQRPEGAGFSKWGDVDIRFVIHDQNGVESIVTVHVPPLADQSRVKWNLNIVGNKNFPPIPIDPVTGTRVGPVDYRFDQGVAGNGYIFIPIAEYAGRAFPPVGAVPFTEIDDGKFYPVINDGSFTIPSGQYEPSHLAKILTDGFDTLDTSRDFGNTVPKNRNFPFGATSPFVYTDVYPDPAPGTGYLVIIGTGNFEQLPFNWSLSALEGWNATFTYRSTAGAGAAIPIAHETVLVIASQPTDAAGSFRIGALKVIPPLSPNPPTYPSNGGMTLILTPPKDYFDAGSAFLQTTENYKINGVDGHSMFAMVDCQNNNNVFSFNVLKNSWIGSNNVEVTYDPDQKRFRFNYMHFPLTSGPSSGPAIINQKTYNYQAGTNTYVRDADSCLNISTTAYGGIFFTSLEPFSSFWQKILGFKSSLLASFGTPSVAADFNDGLTFTPSTVPPADAFSPQIYDGARLPSINLIPGTNITEQLFVLGDLTGKPANYTGIGYDTYSKTATPGDGGRDPPTGRVAVSADDTRPIIAGKGESLGVQTSGYYVVDIDIGTSYNENIGSDQTQLSYSRNMRGIIDRYYSANSYTSSQGGDISYIHYGNSFTLQSLKIRISNSDGSLIDDLGNDNTIFIKVIKNNQINLAPEPLSAPQE